MLRTFLLPLAAGSALLSFNPPQHPAPVRRAHHALVYDETRGAVLLMGGSSPQEGGQRIEVYNDLWVLSDSGWHFLGKSGEPMSSFGAAFDSDRRRIVSFGGYTNQSVGVMRELDGDQWKVLASYPDQPMADPGLVYDSRRKRLVAFGGSAGPRLTYDKTMEFAGDHWVTVSVPGPPGRQAHAMVYDAARGKVVLFGGMGTGPEGKMPPALGDTWEYDGKSWTRRDGEGPSPRRSPGMAYDSKRGLVILFGGSADDGFRQDTWSWDGTNWKRLATTGPEGRAMGFMAYDKKRDRIVLFGGRKGWPNGDLDDTWEWDGTSWKQRTP